ncbi:hypothetical protein CCACVL1_13681 [Corchorus capsularis]|uniref:Uncharacterized protein n=1 Tax=Corchorus capsularis TaxID=210143 RepID=A0A1R3IA38_COCAP|nr:hypothetical protein CCACVL1_13681 [Corchorus capsularis]
MSALEIGNNSMAAETEAKQELKIPTFENQLN